MKISAPKVLALGGLCALLVGAGSAAFAQGDNGQYRHYDHGQYYQTHNYGDGQDSQYRQSYQYRHGNRNERRRLDRLHAAYGRAVRHGHYNVAERAHRRAQAIRARIRAQRQGRSY